MGGTVFFVRITPAKLHHQSAAMLACWMSPSKVSSPWLAPQRKSVVFLQFEKIISRLVGLVGFWLFKVGWFLIAIYQSLGPWNIVIYTPEVLCRPWKMVIGRQAFPIGKITFQGRTVKLRGGGGGTLKEERPKKSTSNHLQVSCGTPWGRFLGVYIWVN